MAGSSAEVVDADPVVLAVQLKFGFGAAGSLLGNQVFDPKPQLGQILQSRIDGFDFMRLDVVGQQSGRLGSIPRLGRALTIKRRLCC